MNLNLLRPVAGIGLMALSLTASPICAMADNDHYPAAAPSLLLQGNGSYELPASDACSMTIPAASKGVRLTVNENWLSATLSPDGIELNATANITSAARQATITAINTAGQRVNITVVQPGDNLTVEATDGIAYATVTAASASSSQGSETPDKTLDGDISTLWHSSYNGFAPGEDVTLTYQLEPTTLEEIIYVPRTEGGVNGIFGQIEVAIATEAGGELTTIIDTDLGISTQPSTLKIPAEFAKTKIAVVQFTIKTAGTVRGDGRMYASCAEMKFVVNTVSPIFKEDGKVFSDNLYTSLAAGVDQARVDKMQDPFLKALAQKMLLGQYKAEGRVAEMPTLRNLQKLSEEFNAPGKQYDQVQGATGITMTQGRYVIIVEGIPEHLNGGSTEMRVVGWRPPTGEGGFWTESFTLRNGINIIDRTTSWDGLAYIANYDEEGYQNGTGSTIRAHFVNAPVNGMITPDMTNDQIRQVLDNATYCIMDCMGQRVHSVWEVDALKTHADGQWVKYLNTLDLIIFWEHRLLGLEKYGRIPSNKTFAYVNYSFYMFQGGYGVSFKYDTQYRVCNPDVIIHSDDDALWGLSHEWGHQHQMAPYFRWTGMAESSNNIFSAYNVLHMGYPVSSSTYRGRFPKDKWEKNGQRIFLDDNYNRTVAPPTLNEDGSVKEYKTANEGDNMVLSLREEAKRAAESGRQWAWNQELKEFAINQPMLPTLRSEDPMRAVNEIEAYSGSNAELTLTPWVRLQFYFAEKDVPNRPESDYKPDLYPDFFEALRQCDLPEGSSIEKKGIDKYELLVSAHNDNKNGKREVFRAKYPNSVWTTHNYLPADKVLNWQANSAPAIMNAIVKLSRLTGYNLWDYFQRWGCITVCALEQGDYGIQWYAMTPEMYEEFRADMQALEDAGELKPLPEETFEQICRSPYPSFPVPNIPNDRPITYSDL
ncbi:MAG: M60 family metallopeptidase [Pseudoflavonifractor sp.]|nr:M60 family metallopeptidase [Alloprevotella sp.]MCM1117506.1 M60 family metallopeptidase [Pseudoflavonifractor sp.]